MAAAHRQQQQIRALGPAVPGQRQPQFAMLCPDKPQLAIYPDMGREERLYAALQRELGLSGHSIANR